MVDLPNEAEREKILTALLQQETLAADVSIESIAKRTKLYSGSDLKNVCIAAALHSVKAQLGIGSKATAPAKDVMEASAPAPPPMDLLSSLSSSATATADETGERVLQKDHFEEALREVPASIREETGSLVELRKWDQKFGEGAKQTLQNAIGF